MLGGERPSSSHARLTRRRTHDPRAQDPVRPCAGDRPGRRHEEPGRPHPGTARAPERGVARAGGMEPVPTLDYRVTSHRPGWEDLPAPVRAAVEAAAGGTVASAGRPVTSGFSGGFAAVLGLDDGRRVFAKAGS